MESVVFQEVSRLRKANCTLPSHVDLDLNLSMNACVGHEHGKGVMEKRDWRERSGLAEGVGQCGESGEIYNKE